MDDIADTILNLEPNKDLYLQIHRNIDFQNSEYYGIKKELIEPFLNSLQNDTLMETHLRNFSNDKDFSFIGPFPNIVPRGGDGIIIRELFSTQ